MDFSAGDQVIRWIGSHDSKLKLGFDLIMTFAVKGERACGVSHSTLRQWQKMTNALNLLPSSRDNYFESSSA